MPLLLTLPYPQAWNAVCVGANTEKVTLTGGQQGQPLAPSGDLSPASRTASWSSHWPIKPDNLSYTALFDWWLKQNSAQRHIWPGMASQKVLVDRQPYEILREISVTRERAGTMPPGHIHWSPRVKTKKLRAGLT